MPKIKPFNNCPLNLNRRSFLQLSASALIATAAASVVSSCGYGRPLKIAAQKWQWPGYSFLYLAQQQGFITPQQVELLETANLGESAAALINGEVDGAALSLDEFVHCLDQGVAVQIVLILDTSAGADMLMVKPDIQSLAALKGKRIGVEKSTLGAIVLIKVLAAAQLNRADITVVEMEFDHVTAWQQGQMDGIITYEPIAHLFKKQGLVSIWDSRQIPNGIVDVLAVRSTVLNSHQNNLTALVLGHFRALDLWQKNPIYTAYLLSSIMRLNPDEIPDVFMNINLPDHSFNRHLLTPPAAELNATLAEVANIMHKEKFIKQLPNLDNVFTADFLPGDLYLEAS